MQDEDGGAPKAGKMEDERAPNQMEDDTAAETPASAAPAGAEPAAAPAGGSGAAAPAAGTTTTTPSAPKTKVLRQALTVQSHFTSGMTEAELNNMIELEVRMAGQDRSIEETAARKNELESYALNMRNAVQEELRDYVRDDVRDSFVRTLNDVESWLYDAGADAQKSEYVARLESVKKVGDPIKRRRVEEEMRPEQVAALKSVIGKYSSLALSQDEKFSHIEQVERDKVVKECNTVDQWLAQALGRQDRLKRHEDPAFTCQELEAKRQQLDAFASAIMGKPKPPPPPPKPAPAPAPAPAGDGKPQAQPAPDAAAPQAQPPQPNGAPAGSSKMDTAEN
jgi:heat shock protein 4